MKEGSDDEVTTIRKTDSEDEIPMETDEEKLCRLQREQDELQGSENNNSISQPKKSETLRRHLISKEEQVQWKQCNDIEIV